jgi:hypothetical protein
MKLDLLQAQAAAAVLLACLTGVAATATTGLSNCISFQTILLELKEAMVKAST